MPGLDKNVFSGHCCLMGKKLRMAGHRRDAAVWSAVRFLRKAGVSEKSDERVPGDGDCMQSVLSRARKAMQNRYRLAVEGIRFEQVTTAVAQRFSILFIVFELKKMKNIRLVFACLIVSLLLGCANSVVSGPSVERDLLEQLTSLEGIFSWNDGQQIFDYNKRGGIEKLIEGRNVEETLRILADNIDNPRPSNSMINGKKVVLGVVCYTAIAQIAYFEPAAKDGDVAEAWAGHLSPEATMEELSKAKMAWQAIIELQLYFLL